MDPTFLPAWRLAELTRSGAVSCAALLDHYLARVERLDGQHQRGGRARLRAARDAAPGRWTARGRGEAPLFGVPMTVKESFDLAGLPTTWGHADQRAASRREPMRWRSSGWRRRARWCSARPTCRWGSPTGRASTRSTAPRTIRGTSRIRRAARPAAARRRAPPGFGGAGDRQRHRRLDPRAGAFLRRCSATSRPGGCAPPRGHSLSNAAALTDISVIGPLARSARDLALALDAIAGPDPLDSEPAASRCRRRAPRGCPSCASRSGRSEPGHETDAETVGADRRAGAPPGARGATVSRDRTAGVSTVDRGVPALSQRCSTRR